jgi:hypothetical protein
VTVDDERQGLPSVPTCPDAAQIRRPTFVRRRRYRGRRLDSRSMPGSTNSASSSTTAHTNETKRGTRPLFISHWRAKSNYSANWLTTNAPRF